MSLSGLLWFGLSFVAVAIVSADKRRGVEGPWIKLNKTQSDVWFFTDPKVQRKHRQGEWGRRWAEDTKRESKEVLPAAS